MKFGVCLTCLLYLIDYSCGLRILVVFPVPSKSHSILGHGVVNRLLEYGHEVVHVTAFPSGKTVPKLKEIDASFIVKGMQKQQESSKEDQLNLQTLMNVQNLGDTTFFLMFTHFISQQLMTHEPFIEFLSDPKQKFDTVILEWFFSETTVGIPSLFNCPYIWVGTTEAHWQVLKVIDEIPNPAYSVDLFSTSRPPLSIWERTEELWMIIKKYVKFQFLVTPREKELYNSVYPKIAAKRGVTMPSYEDALYNASFLFLNSHPSLGTSYKLPQNAKYIGGYHIDNVTKPLPQDLQKFMDDAKHGVIYFSMGSNLKSNDMSLHMKNSLLKMFGKLQQDILWKFEGDLENVPKNVKLIKWAPQQSILAHPNLRLFLTHGGQLSTTEAIHYGVPVIGIPVLGDQFVNMRAAVNKGFGIQVKLSEELAEPLHAAIKEMLTNPSYKTRAKDLSIIYHDRPVPPGRELVHWVEHVVKTGGALYMRSPALMVTWYQKLFLDVIGLFFVVILILYVTIKKLFAKSRATDRDSKSMKRKTK